MTVGTAATRVEAIAEAMEDMMLAVCAESLQKFNKDPQTREQLEHYLQNSRAHLRDALREFLKPMLRLQSGRKQGFDQDIPAEDRPLCRECNRRRPCADVNCPHWAAAIRNTINNRVLQGGGDATGDLA